MPGSVSALVWIGPLIADACVSQTRMDMIKMGEVGVHFSDRRDEA